MNKFLIKRAIVLIMLGFGITQILAALLGFFFQEVAGAWKPYLPPIVMLSTYGGLLLGLWLWDRYQRKR